MKDQGWGLMDGLLGAKLRVRSKGFIPAEALTNHMWSYEVGRRIAACGEVIQAGTGRLLDTKYNGPT